MATSSSSSSSSSLTATPATTKDAEAALVAESLVRRPPTVSAASSWEGGAGLTSVLRLVPEGDTGACEALWGPLQNGEIVVVLERQLNNENIAPCFLYLNCDTHRSEEIIGLCIISEARNMEIYIGEEYCATARGEKVFTVPNDSKNDHVTLYKKYLKLDSPVTACNIKLLSLGEKEKLLISKIIVQIKQNLCAKYLPDFAALESSIDLDRVQGIMESMGSKLSPGAQQLLDMVRFQQKNGLPFGGKLQNILGRKGLVSGNNHIIDGLHKAADVERFDHLSDGPSFKSVSVVQEDLKAYTDTNKQVLSSENRFESRGVHTPQHTTLLSHNDFKGLVSSFLQEQADESPPKSNSTLLLPFLQTVCGQVNSLRIDERNKHYASNSVSEDDGIQAIGSMEQQSICLYLEKIIPPKMELMEKRLIDYIDLRIKKLEEHLDAKVAAIMDAIQNSKNVSLAHDPSREEHRDEK